MIDVKEFVKQKFNIERELYLHNKVDDMDYVDLIQLLNDFQQQLLNKHNVSGSLPMYDVDELNEIIKLFNNKEIDLYTCIGRVWNKAYFIGANEGMKAGQLGNNR